MEPIKDDREFLECLRVLVIYEAKFVGKFLTLPEDPTWRDWEHCLKLRRLVRDYLNADERLGARDGR